MEDRKTRIRKGFIPEVHVIDDFWVSYETIQDYKTSFCDCATSIPIIIEEQEGKRAADAFKEIFGEPYN